MSSAATTPPARTPSLLAELTGIRVRVISEEPVVRVGVRCLLGSRSDSLVFVEDAHEEGADAVLYDVLSLCRTDGKDLEELVARHPGRVLALSRALQPGLTARALVLGAVAAVPLGAAPEELLAAVHDLFEGRFQDGSPADLANRRDRDHRLGRQACLSPREHEVLGLIVSGASNREIAVALNISHNTVKSLIRAAYQKIDVASRSQAVAWGVEHGFPPRPDQRATAHSGRSAYQSV
jgi:DNA-binding NarL/FixJ family response regulator